MGRHVFSHLQESRAPSDFSYLSRPTPELWLSPLPSSFSQLYMLSVMPGGVGYPMGWLGPAVPAVSPPSFLCPPQPPHWQAGTRARKGLDSVQAQLNIPVLSSLFSEQFQVIVPCQLLWGKLALTQRKQNRGLSDWILFKGFLTLPNITSWFECHSCLDVFCS